MENLRDLFQEIYELDEFYFYCDGALDDYFLESNEGEMVYEARKIEDHWFKDDLYLFKNYLFLKENQHKVSNNTLIPCGKSAIRSAHFKIDDEDNYDFFKRNHLRIILENNGFFKYHVGVYRDNIQIAYVEKCNENPFNSNNINQKGIFTKGLKVRAYSKDLDYVFLVCMTLERMQVSDLRIE